MCPAPDPAGFRQTMGHLPTGVTVVTASTDEGPVGMTANAVCSLSLQPLLLLVCFDNASRTLPLIERAGRFAVNVLAADQAGLSRRFASPELHELEKFGDVAHEIRDGLPRLSGAVAWVACLLQSLHPGGDHTIGVGAVEGFESDGGRDPLVWLRGRYGRVDVG